MSRHAYAKTSSVHCAYSVGMDSAQCPSHGHDTVWNRHIPQRFPLYILRTIWKCLAAFCEARRVTAHNANFHIDDWSFNLVLASQSAYGHNAGLGRYVWRAFCRMGLGISSIFHTYCKPGFPRRIFVALYLAQTYRISLSTASLTGAHPSASHHSLPSFAAVSNALAGLHPRRCAA